MNATTIENSPKNLLTVSVRLTILFSSGIFIDSQKKTSGLRYQENDLNQYYAATNIDEALDRTKHLLWPPRTGIWIRIAIIALFLGGGIINPLRTDKLHLSGINNSGIPGPAALSGYMDLILTVTIGICVAGLIYVVISSILQFVFVDCLSSGTILLTRTFRLRWGKGLHLVGFYVVLLFIILLCTFGLAALLIIPAFASGFPDMVTLLILVIEILILLLIILIPVWIIAILTADFVVPVMIVDEIGIIAGWKRVYRLFNGRWIEAGIYTSLKILIIFITGVALGAIVFIISIPMGIISAIGTIGTNTSPVFDPAGLFTLALGTVAIFLISLILLVPVITYFRYYSLTVLRDLDTGYNLLSDYLSSNKG